MTRTANERQPLSGASPAAAPLRLFPRCRPHHTGTDRPRAPTPGTGVAFLLLHEADRGGSAAAITHRCEPSRPLPGRSAGNLAALAPEGRLVGMRAGGANSVGSISVRGKRTATPMWDRRAADSDRVDDVLDPLPSTTQSSTPPTRRRRLPRPVGLGDALRCHRAATPVKGVTCRCASALAVVPTTRGRTSRVRRRPARTSPFSSSTRPTVAALPPQSRIAASRPAPSRGGALVTRQRSPQKAVS